MSPRKRGAAPRARNGNAPQRQRLIEACISALHLYGPSRTTVEKVVAIARMSPGIVRFYFDSKAAMMVASLQFLAAEFEDRVLTPVAQLKGTPVAALERMVELYLDPDIASPRKVSVWYAFWGEASSRQEYYDICGQKDASFAALVQELIERLIDDSGLTHLDAGGVALGLIGVLEMLWQDFAFQSEGNIDRRAARARARAYLRSVFPGHFERPAAAAAAPGAPRPARPARLASWAYMSEAAHRIEREALFRPSMQLLGHALELERPGEYLTGETATERVLLVRGEDGRIRALRNCCPLGPHALVLERRGQLAGEIECGVHRLRFAWDGAPRPVHAERAARALTGLELEDAGGLLFVRGTAPANGEGWPRELKPLARARPIELEADWKILIEQWLEGEGRAAPDPMSWSARRYRSLAGPRALEGWSERFIEPNLWLEQRPGGCSIVQPVPMAAGRCRLERLDFVVAGSPYGPGERVERALQYLATRLVPRLRRAARLLAESAQQGLVLYDYPRPAGAAGARFQRRLLERAPALGLDRAPLGS